MDKRLARLPFASGGLRSGISLWRSGLRCGQKLADAALAYMKIHDAPMLLGHVAKAQIAGGGYGKTEIEFWHRISERAMEGTPPEAYIKGRPATPPA